MGRGADGGAAFKGEIIKLSRERARLFNDAHVKNFQPFLNVLGGRPLRTRMSKPTKIEARAAGLHEAQLGNMIHMRLRCFGPEWAL